MIVLIVSVGLNVGLLGALVIDALREGHHRFEGIPPFPGWIQEMEGLSPAQKEEIRTIMNDNAASVEKLRSEIAQKRGELSRLITTPEPDLAAIDKKINEISDLHTQMEKLIISEVISIRGVLTPEQRQILSEHMSRFIAPPPPPDGGGMMKGRQGHWWRWGRPNR
jgi:uncharacterized membrane protein